ncbi:MAG: Pycsar system effector family protein [Aeromicrobium sp.]
MDEESASQEQPFADVVGRESVDQVLLESRQELVMLVGQADMKASILIGACSLAITGALIGWSVVWPGALATMAAFSVISLVLAVAAVAPGPMNKVPEGGVNLMYVGHFVHLERDEFVRRWAAMARTDEDLYRAAVLDLWSLGRHLVRSKYRYLRLAYYAFLVGTVSASVLAALHPLGIIG